MYLVRFNYDHYCQGYEKASETVLVKDVEDFDDACTKIAMKYKNARDFENLTISGTLLGGKRKRSK
jgi:hypothetical protein